MKFPLRPNHLRILSMKYSRSTQAHPFVNMSKWQWLELEKNVLWFLFMNGICSNSGTDFQFQTWANQEGERRHKMWTRFSESWIIQSVGTMAICSKPVSTQSLLAILSHTILSNQTYQIRNAILESCLSYVTYSLWSYFSELMLCQKSWQSSRAPWRKMPGSFCLPFSFLPRLPVYYLPII